MEFWSIATHPAAIGGLAGLLTALEADLDSFYKSGEGRAYRVTRLLARLAKGTLFGAATGAGIQVSVGA